MSSIPVQIGDGYQLRGPKGGEIKTRTLTAHCLVCIDDVKVSVAPDRDEDPGFCPACGWRRTFFQPRWFLQAKRERRR